MRKRSGRGLWVRFMPMVEDSSKPSRTALWGWVLWWPFALVNLTMLVIMCGLAKVLEWTMEALLVVFEVLGVPLLKTWPQLLRGITIAMLLIWTGINITACQSTITYSGATVSVRDYTRSDGTRVGSYSRRAPGVAAADRRMNDETMWMRWIIGFGWLMGCGVIWLFFACAAFEQRSSWLKRDP